MYNDESAAVSAASKNTKSIRICMIWPRGLSSTWLAVTNVVELQQHQIPAVSCRKPSSTVITMTNFTFAVLKNVIRIQLYRFLLFAMCNLPRRPYNSWLTAQVLFYTVTVPVLLRNPTSNSSGRYYRWRRRSVVKPLVEARCWSPRVSASSNVACIHDYTSSNSQ